MASPKASSKLDSRGERGGERTLKCAEAGLAVTELD
jgi:hypothetical protein